MHELESWLQVSQGNVSQQLAKLRDRGIVSCRRWLNPVSKDWSLLCAPIGGPQNDPVCMLHAPEYASERQ